MDNVFVLVISGREKEWGESKLLTEGTEFVLSDCHNKFKSFTGQDNFSDIGNYCFALVCEKAWTKSNNYKDLFKAASTKFDCMINYIHISGGINRGDFNEYKNPLTVEFHHNVEICASLRPLLEAVSSSPTTANDLFNDLVNITLTRAPKPYLIALSILCQGYRAADGDVSLFDCDNEATSEFFTMALSQKEFVDERTWWQQIFNPKESFSCIRHEFGSELTEDKHNNELCELLRSIDNLAGAFPIPEINIAKVSNIINKILSKQE